MKAKFEIVSRWTGAVLFSVELQIGCHKHTFDYWQENAERVGKLQGYSALDVEIYKLHIEHARRVSQLLWAKKETVKETAEVQP